MCGHQEASLMGVVGHRDGSMRFGGRKLGHQPVTLTCSLCDHGKIILLPASVKDDNADVYSIVRTVKEKKIFCYFRSYVFGKN